VPDTEIPKLLGPGRYIPVVGSLEKLIDGVVAVPSIIPKEEAPT
jgi:hypothetical protein